MLNKNYAFALCLGLLLGYPPSPAHAEAAKKKVTLPLGEYLALVERAEANEKLAAARDQKREKPLAEVLVERIALRLEDKEAKLDSVFEVLIQGEPIKPVWLPLAGYAAKVNLQKLDERGVWGPAPKASLTAFSGSDGGKVLVTREAGRYRVEAESRLPLDIKGGKIELQLLKVAAPVASAEIDLPADLEWSSPGSVVVGESISGGRRRVELATQRGTATLLRAQRRFAQGEDKTLAHAVVLTLLQLRPEGLRRHDVVFYEVSRGQLSSFEVTLPPGLEIEEVATDEGLMVPLSEGKALRIERRNQLQGTGYLVLSSTPGATGELAWSRVEPKVEVRARYLAVTSSLAAEIAPQPAASFSQIDLSDLPPLLGQALGAVRLAAAWRLQDDKLPTSLRIAALPAAETLGTTVLERETTTLLTVDGTLLHHETFTLAPSARPASYFEVTLPAGATLWSAKVDEQPTRPLMRGGKLVLPIVPSAGKETTLEVISVLEQAVPPGRSQLAIELARVGTPVLEQSWRLLLPDGPLYRFSNSELDRVQNEAPLLDERSVGKKVNDKRDRQGKDRDDNEEKETGLAAANYSLQVGELKQGLVSGVRPLPITIPENGKALMLTGVLPPERVSVTIDVKARK